MGLLYNGKHSWNDFRITIAEKKILPPPKTKIKEIVPFMNGTYDFSTVGTNGEQVYGEREIEVKFTFPTHSKYDLYGFYTQVLEWLQDTGRQQLIFDDMPDFYFMAEVEAAGEFEEVLTFGNLTVKFVAQPIKYGVSEEGTEQLWDSFNFDTDVMQDTAFDVATTKTIIITNVGRIVYPIINISNVTAQMSIAMGTTIFGLVNGDNNLPGFNLQHGDNSLTINGTGHIEFHFRKESL